MTRNRSWSLRPDPKRYLSPIADIGAKYTPLKAVGVAICSTGAETAVSPFVADLKSTAGPHQRARVSDLLTEMLGDVLNDVERDAAFGTLPAIPFESFFRVGIGHGADGCFGVGVGRLERGDNLLCRWWTARGLSCWSGSTHQLIEVEVGRARVQENFGDAADVQGRTPLVFIGGNSFGEADESAFLDYNFGQDFRAASHLCRGTLVPRPEPQPQSPEARIERRGFVAWSLLWRFSADRMTVIVPIFCNENSHARRANVGSRLSRKSFMKEGEACEHPICKQAAQLSQPKTVFALSQLNVSGEAIRATSYLSHVSYQRTLWPYGNFRPLQALPLSRESRSAPLP